jgi:hypothetical protein
MPTHKPTLPPVAQPKIRPFDPWNSSSSGHQRPETKGPQGWQHSRNMKLQSQFSSGRTGGARISDTVGVGSEDFDEKHKVLIPKDVRARAQNSVMDMLQRPGPIPTTQTTTATQAINPGGSRQDLGDDPPSAKPCASTDEGVDAGSFTRLQPPTAALAPGTRKIFDGLCIYINGSTHPMVSDHKLKHLLSENGARTSISLSRRQVTHVIVGKPNGRGGGAGGGLAGGKMEKEIRHGRGCGIKYVGVEW